jgi:hypothetical protein
MTKESGTFQPVGSSNARMHGTTSLLVSGFSVAEQATIREMLNESELTHIPIVFVADDLAHMTLAELTTLPDGRGEGAPSTLRRGTVMSGLTETELHRLMAAYRESGMAQQHWACVTPNSEGWPIAHLLDELAREQETLKDAMANKTPPGTDQ